MNDPVNPITLRDFEIRNALELIINGETQKSVAEKIGVTTKTIRDWLQKFPDLVREIHEAVKLKATLERPRNLKALVRIRDTSKNHSARVKSVAVLEAMAGAVVEKKDGIPTIVIIGGQQVNVGTMRGTELDELMKQSAERAGPEYKQVIDAVVIGRAAKADRRGDPGRGEEDHGGTPEDPPAAVQ